MKRIIWYLVRALGLALGASTVVAIGLLLILRPQMRGLPDDSIRRTERTLRIKRITDVILSAAGLVVLSPLLGVIALSIRLTSPGPVLYRATRIGKDAVPFRLYKFRSMVEDADRVGPAITVGQDPRVTPIGRLLRRTKLDELPQLLNVLRGEMSLVGPRPEDPRFVDQYTREQRHVLDVRPGITSPASVAYRNEESLLCGSDWERVYREQLLPAKLAIDLEYAKEPTLRRDVAILLKTAVALLH